MSDTLMCMAESVAFYKQDLCDECTFEYVSIKADSFINVEKGDSIPQNENKYAKHNHSTVENRTAKQTLPRKREASNILVECVKRRDNLRNIDITYAMPSKYPSCNRVSLGLTAMMSGKINNLVTTEYLASSGSNLEMEGLKNNSPVHRSDTPRALCLEEAVVTNLMDIDCGTVDCETSSKSAADHLVGLHLTDTSSWTEDPSLPNWPILQSLFRGVPSTILFSSKEEKGISLSNPDVLKWKLSSITPAVIKETVLKAGFSLVQADTTEAWLGTWGKHLKCRAFKGIRKFQKVNHYPGGFHLGRKDRLWENYSRMCSRHGTEAFDFFPQTYILPQDLKSLKEAWEADSCWIVKPCASARGTGVKVIYKWSQVPKTSPFVVQRYISNPYLINGSKFDLRLYVMISSLEPLRIYIFEDGLVRFASEKYSLANKSFANRFIHLTNYSINRKNSTYSSNDDENLCQGHKWSLKSFWAYMSNSGIDIDKIQTTISDMIIKTIISAEGPMCRLLKTHAKSPYNCFELFGFDIMLDKDLHPWLLEVNISPSLHTKSMLDSHVKGPLVRDMLNIAGFEVPGAWDTSRESGAPPSKRHKPPHNRWLSQEERQKHALYSYEHSEVKSNILDCLTSDDLHCLTESEDELQRCGSFRRIFPTANTYEYFAYFDHIRYYNVLLDAWEKTFHLRRNEGVSLLQTLCEQRLLRQEESFESIC